ncbi:cytochrome P450 [Pterulicium gracile]|uniref:Cytochrome P450 n=1 Tax=Pterulicium gracile TaxID=1884261 RepID=A0A5C3QPQ7_9AGAR|nr:cytochrome P450 [Pterula gracilis]
MQILAAVPIVNMYTLAVLAVAAIFLPMLRRKRKKYPPGPAGLPIIGNMFDMPSQFQWITFANWSKDYGSPVVHARIFGQSVVVLNSHQSVNDLLEKRSSLYSDRPRSIMFQEIMALGTWSLPFMGYGPAWRIQRQMFHSSFHPNTVSSYRPVSTECTRKFLRQLHESPEKFRDHIHNHAGRIIMKIVYGYDIKDEGDHYVWLIDEHFRIINERCDIGSIFLVDYIPSLRYLPSWVPGFTFQNIGEEYRAVADELVDRPFEDVHALLAAGTAIPSIVSQHIEHVQQVPNITAAQQAEEYLQIKNMAATAYPAGKDTTASAISAIFLGLVLNPGQLKRAQQELDVVTRGVRLPGFEDRDALHYIDCLVLEALRWNPASPTAFAHRLLQDDEYKGYLIPKGSLVLGNTWALCRDEGMFPDPDNFNPDRYLRGPKGERHPAEAYVAAAFGYGRRACPGRSLALDTIWLTIAQVLAIFDVLKDVDERGAELTPNVKFTHGLVSQPETFACRIVPRSEAALLLLHN